MAILCLKAVSVRVVTAGRVRAGLPALAGSHQIQVLDRRKSLASSVFIKITNKAATMNFVKSLAKQLGPKGIRVNGVAPGPIWTALQVSGGATQEKLQKFGGNTPLGRPGQPAELGSIYVQLAANDASFATGQIYGSARRRRPALGRFGRELESRNDGATKKRGWTKGSMLSLRSTAESTY